MIGRCPGHRAQRAGAAAVIAATLLVATACGASPTSPNQAPGATDTAVPTPSATVVSAASASATLSASEAPAQAPRATTIQVPEGTGLDYQSAQDLWRAAGLIVAPAKDATGADRIPVIDANWIVVSQDPQAGSQVDAGSFITATVKKDSDG